MSDYSYLHDRIAAHQIAERVERTQRSRLVPRRRGAGRHALASGLHHLAARLDV